MHMYRSIFRSRNAPHQISAAVKTGWAAGDLGTACFVGASMVYLLFYLTQAQGFSPVIAGLALLVPRAIDVVLDPLMGMISDRTVSRFGRRRPYLLLGSVVFAVPFYLMFDIPDFRTEAARIGYFTVMYLLTSIGYTMFAIPHAAMVAEMTQDYRERISIMGYRMMGSRLGILVVMVLGAYVFTTRESLVEGFRLFGAVFGAAIAIGGIISFVATRSVPRVDTPAGRFDLLDEVRAVFRNKPFVALLRVFLAQNLAIGAAATTIVYFVTFVMGVQTRNVGWWISIAAIAATLATPAWTVIGQRMGKIATYRTAILIQLVVYLCICLFVGPSVIWLLVGLFIILGVGDAACQLAPNAMMPDTVEAGELHAGTRREGAISGAMSACLKLGMAGGAFLASAVLDVFGFVSGASVQHDQALLGIRLAYALLPVLLWVGVLLLLRGYDLTEERFEKIKVELAQRRTANAAASENRLSSPTQRRAPPAGPAAPLPRSPEDPLAIEYNGQ
ncbi:MAG TPA: glycoside-pentoside-hexuronide (GPH):cation symporter [Woeseiaceae bacterium]|nr:glycoside-pentoside-hexuronide (GPH):cation symporter [Woeseiaceae bacterium]